MKHPLALQVAHALCKDYLDRFPSVYMTAIRLNRRRSSTVHSLLASDSDLVIDAFPRSGASFVCRVFEDDKQSRPKLAHHVHHSSHVIKGCRAAIPTLVLIRNPRDAVISLKALNIQNLPGDRAARDFPIVLWTRWYAHFYERIKPFLDCIVLADFSQVTTDAGRIVDRVNGKFGTRFEGFSHDERNEQRIFRRYGHYLSPDARRDHIKSQIASEYDEAANGAWAERAEKVYSSLLRHT